MNYRQQPPPTAQGYRPPPGYQQQQPPQQAEAELVTPTPTGKKAVVAMNIQVLVEVNDTEVYSDMVAQAQEDLARRVVEARTFLPMQMKSERIYSDVTVAELKSALIVPPGTQWRR